MGSYGVFSSIRDAAGKHPDTDIEELKEREECFVICGYVTIYNC
jgi:hypothetical protein